MALNAAEFVKHSDEPAPTIADAAMGACAATRQTALRVFDEVYAGQPERARAARADSDERQRRWLISLILRLRTPIEP
jgi:hypothetical protein